MKALVKKINELSSILECSREDIKQTATNEKLRELKKYSKMFKMKSDFNRWFNYMNEMQHDCKKKNSTRLEDYQLITAETAEKANEKSKNSQLLKTTDQFSQYALHKAHEKRVNNARSNIDSLVINQPDLKTKTKMTIQNAQNESDPNENIKRMVTELENQISKRANFSRRRKYRSYKNAVSSIAITNCARAT
jgi:hypothetical protein